MAGPQGGSGAECSGPSAAASVPAAAVHLPLATVRTGLESIALRDVSQGRTKTVRFHARAECERSNK